MITIDYLKFHSGCIPELASIWHEVLGKVWIPDVPLSRVEENLRNHLNLDQLPLTFLAMDASRPVGMCSLRITDGILPELTPWLGSLVIAKNYQRQGIAGLLIDHAKEKARMMGFKILYLFTFSILFIWCTYKLIA